MSDVKNKTITKEQFEESSKRVSRSMNRLSRAFKTFNYKMSMEARRAFVDGDSETYIKETRKELKGSENESKFEELIKDFRTRTSDHKGQ